MMIDPATGWFNMTAIKTKSAVVIANKIEQMWLSKYPWPSKVILDQGTEVMKEKTTGLHAAQSQCRIPKQIPYWKELTKP